MATNYTTNVRLQKPSTADRQWDVPLNANADYLDGLAAVGGLTVTPLEVPSASLSCRVSAGTYLKSDGSLGSFAGASSLALAPGATLFVWLTDAGVPGTGAAFPTTPHLRLAQVKTGPATILQVVDARMAYQSVGANTVFVAKAGDTIAGALQVTSPTTGTPVLSLDPTNQLIGFFGTAAATQAPRLNPLTDSTGGTASDVLSNVGASFSQATLNNNFASIAAKVDALIAALKRHGLMSS
jgi:hypothetical protein